MNKSPRHFPPWRPKEKGYGLLEYLILLGLATLAISAVYLVFGPDIESWLDSLTRRSATPGPELQVIETGKRYELLEAEAISIRNCGSEPPVTSVERSYSFVHQFILDAELDAEVEDVLLRPLQEHYGFWDGQQDESNYVINLPLENNSGADFTLEWNYLWNEGQLVIQWPDETESVVPYQVLTGVEFTFLEITPVSCP